MPQLDELRHLGIGDGAVLLALPSDEPLDLGACCSHCRPTQNVIDSAGENAPGRSLQRDMALGLRFMPYVNILSSAGSCMVNRNLPSLSIL
jgi:NifB/MoaA-like Fe-S oxidoreductase